MPEAWHPFVFDSEARRFVGDFEGMYRAEAAEGFDSWHQTDPRRLDGAVSELLIDRITYSTALDLGCGKGFLTARLKRRDNHVVGIDSSPTAVELAANHYPDLEWHCADVFDYLGASPRVDLVVARELLSYVANWRALLERCAAVTRYMLVGLYLPDDPIGFVPSFAALEQELERWFELVHIVYIASQRHGIYMCERRTSHEAPETPPPNP